MKNKPRRKVNMQKPSFLIKQTRKALLSLLFFCLIMLSQQIDNPLVTELNNSIKPIVAQDYNFRPLIKKLEKADWLPQGLTLSVFNPYTTQKIKSDYPLNMNSRQQQRDVPSTNQAENKPDSIGETGPTGGDVGGKTDDTLKSSAAEEKKTETNAAKNNEKTGKIPEISMPVNGVLSSPYGMRKHPILNEPRFHNGIDIDAKEGEPVISVMDGVVKSVRNSTTYGKIVKIDHGNGIVTSYAHCSAILVKEKEHIKKGQIIAKVGNTGLSTGPHLHFEITEDNKSVDPMTRINAGRK